MNRVIVSIISEQTIPNYIFIKEKFQTGDELLFITSSKMEKKIDWITLTLKFFNPKISKIILEDNEEERWEIMCSKIGMKLNKNDKYIVNLTGGTKYMSTAIHKVFEEHDSQFYYIPFPKNQILIYNKDINPISLKYRVSIEEYMNLHNVKYKNKISIIDKEFTDKFFKLFAYNKFQSYEKEILNIMRQYRDLEKVGSSFRLSKKIEISNIEKGIIKGNKTFQAIPELSTFLRYISFPLKENGVIREDEIQYLTGGWFEEYIYNIIIKEINPTDIVLGVDIDQNEYTNKNDLDVVFTYGNKLFVIECKTGISKTENRGEEIMFKEIAYKAATIKGTLLGLPGNSFIVSLSEGNERFKKTAKNMGITYYDKSYFLENEKLKLFINDIINYAKN